MLNSLWEGMENQRFSRWTATTLVPTLIFWFGGFLVLILHNRWAVWERWLTQSSSITQNALFVSCVLIIALSIAIVSILESWVLLLLLGNWPSWLQTLLNFSVEHYWESIEDMERKWQALETKKDRERRENKRILTFKERTQCIKLEHKLRLVPPDEKLWMPTRLGNIVRAAERRTTDKYGLSVGICWPRLWLLLPENVQTDLAETHSSFDASVRIWIWAMLFTIWGWFVWWMLLSGLVLAIAVYYLWVLNAAETYCDLVESTFDVYRARLFQALRWPLPTNPAEERKLGEQLMEYLARGYDQPIPTFTKII